MEQWKNACVGCHYIRVGRRVAAEFNDSKNVEDNRIFLPFVCGTLGPWCVEAVEFVKILGDMVTAERVNRGFKLQRTDKE